MRRQIEKNKTYRIKHGSSYNLLQVLSESGSTLQVKDLKTGNTKTLDKERFQKLLDNGSIYVSAQKENL